MEGRNGIETLRIGTMCQLIEIVCHTTQLANEVSLLHGQAFYHIPFIKNSSYKFTHGYSCTLSFALECIVILSGKLYRDAVFFFSAAPLVGRPPLLYSDLVIIVFYFDLMETSGIILYTYLGRWSKWFGYAQNINLLPEK